MQCAVPGKCIAKIATRTEVLTLGCSILNMYDENHLKHGLTVNVLHKLMHASFTN